jgi:hypothetical protein
MFELGVAVEIPVLGGHDEQMRNDQTLLTFFLVSWSILGTTASVI